MPYRREGNKVLHKKGGSWKVKQVCDSAEAAEKAIRLLQGIEHGMIPKNKRKAIISGRRKK